VNDTAEWSTRTFGNEDRLPRVPLPTLDASCDRFLEWCAPLLTTEQLAQTEEAVAAFRAPDGPGPRLHAALEEHNNAPGVRSWLDRFWARRYLGRRDRIALNANFFYLFREAPGDQGKGQVDRAAGLIASALDYKHRLNKEEIPPIIQRGQAMSMVQNKFLFSETRIPGQVQDTVRVPYSDEWPGPSRFRHIVVMVGGRMFWMEVLGPDGTPFTLDELADGLRAVLKAGAERAEPDGSVGHLTTKARAEWAASREVLRNHHPTNAAALEAIESALFFVCLDDVTPVDTLAACDHLLHGDSSNRYFDKALSFIVFADGTAGINVEHCGLDGITILGLVDMMLSTSAAEQSARSGARSQGTPTSAEVPFVLDVALRADIAAAAASFRDFADNTASAEVSIADFGNERAKALRVSPDAFAQLAFQLAHHRAKGFVGATYESIATRHWQNGRTEAMRVVTPEVVRFVAAMNDPSADAAARRAAFRAAASKHVERARECQAGDAPEQHLWELLLIQNRQGAELGVPEPPALYGTPGWLVMRDDYLSTSSAPSPNVVAFGFGSTSSHCIGVAYALMPDNFYAYLSTPRAVAEEMHRFADELRAGFRELEELLAAEV
jgi:carnitine O-acetyltransferase